LAYHYTYVIYNDNVFEKSEHYLAYDAFLRV